MALDFLANLPTSVILGSALVTIIILGVALGSNKRMRRDGSDYSSSTATVSLLNNSDSVLKKDEVHGSISEYEGLFDGARKSVGHITSDESIEMRKSKYQTMVNNFYNLVTDFYEWGWGQSFHFAPRYMGETFLESIKRAEYHLSSRLQLCQTSKVLDIGCGIGGPMRNMAVFSGADFSGITINEYQVRIGNKYCKQKGLDHRCRLVQGDFQNLPFPHDTYDAAFAIEATCHSPDRIKVFKGIADCLKVGGLFAGYEWIVLDQYDPSNPNHVRIKEGIEVGNGLPTLSTAQEVKNCLEAAGFEIVEAYDANRGVKSPYEVPWYDTLNGSYSISGFRMTWAGRMCTHSMVTVLEFLGIAPKGSVRVSALLNATAIDLVEGGKDQIFTPSYYFLARKLDPKNLVAK